MTVMMCCPGSSRSVQLPLRDSLRRQLLQLQSLLPRHPPQQLLPHRLPVDLRVPLSMPPKAVQAVMGQMAKRP